MTNGSISNDENVLLYQFPIEMHHYSVGGFRQRARLVVYPGI